MNAYPKFGTHPIKCGNSRCTWRGYETGQAKVEKKGALYSVCPLCGCNSYSFMTDRECKRSGLEVIL